MQIVVGTKSGETHSFETSENQEKGLTGLKIGEEFNGSLVGLNGYTLELKGGSDKNGFPMKKQVQGPGRQSVLVENGTGVRHLAKGERKRKTVHGNTVSEEIVQLNCKVVEEGEKSIKQILEVETQESEETGEKETSEEEQEDKEQEEDEERTEENHEEGE
ncbi:MAG: 30S ribosomal protein S6e [Candidatus Nanohaloarchaeota archaeon QJJ-9]|nr:30S ribosomal protein S6e [Candidatus Nanohaloarchaeota archaeon QJJ-9]